MNMKFIRRLPPDQHQSHLLKIVAQGVLSACSAGVLRYLTDRDVDLFVKLARSAVRKFESASLPHPRIRAAYALAILAHPLKRGVLLFSKNDGLIHALF